MSNTTIKRHFADYCELDESLKYSGLYTDLCGMSIEDFIKSNNHCHCGGGDNGGENEDVTTKKNNTLIFSVNQSDFLTANLTYTPTQQISLSCKCEGEDLEFTFTNNVIIVSEFKPTTNVITITDIVFNPTEDEKYKYGDYIIKNKTSEAKVFIPNIAINFKDISKISNISLDELTETKVDNDGAEIKFNFTTTNDLPENFYDEDFDYESWRSENSFVPVLFLEKEKFDNKLISIYVGSSEITNYFTQIATKQINNTVYSVLVKTTNDTNAQYLEYNGLWVNTYSADTDTNIEYIIKEQK